MIEEVSRQMFRQFSTCVKQHLEVAEAPQPESNTPAEPETKAVAAAPLAFRAMGHHPSLAGCSVVVMQGSTEAGFLILCTVGWPGEMLR